MSSSLAADAAGTWQLGDLTVNRLGFGAKQLTGDPAGDGPPSDITATATWPIAQI
jgi:pyridoxine 4-dehydrogenase